MSILDKIFLYPHRICTFFFMYRQIHIHLLGNHNSFQMAFRTAYDIPIWGTFFAIRPHFWTRLVHHQLNPHISAPEVSLVSVKTIGKPQENGKIIGKLQENHRIMEVYPLVNVYMTMERSTMFHGKIHYFDWAIFNSFLQVYQRVYPINILYKNHSKIPCNRYNIPLNHYKIPFQSIYPMKNHYKIP